MEGKSHKSWKLNLVGAMSRAVGDASILARLFEWEQRLLALRTITVPVHLAAAGLGFLPQGLWC